MEYKFVKYRKGFARTEQVIIIEASSLGEAAKLANDDGYGGEQLVDISFEEVFWEELKEEWLEDKKKGNRYYERD